LSKATGRRRLQAKHKTICRGKARIEGSIPSRRTNLAFEMSSSPAPSDVAGVRAQ